MLCAAELGRLRRGHSATAPSALSQSLCAQLVALHLTSHCVWARPSFRHRLPPFLDTPCSISGHRLQVAGPLGKRLVLFGQAKRGERTFDEARKVREGTSASPPPCHWSPPLYLLCITPRVVPVTRRLSHSRRSCRGFRLGLSSCRQSSQVLPTARLPSSPRMNSQSRSLPTPDFLTSSSCDSTSRLATHLPRPRSRVARWSPLHRAHADASLPRIHRLHPAGAPTPPAPPRLPPPFARPRT